MKNSTKSKHSTALDTATKKTSRWFRLQSHRGEIEQLFDLYWGGKERRITGLTLRIMGVNAIAVIALLFGVIYLGQTHSKLIEAELVRFETEVFLVTAAVAEVSRPPESVSADIPYFLYDKTVKNLVVRMGATMNKRILIFGLNDTLLADSEALADEVSIEKTYKVVQKEKRVLDSVELLKNTARSVVSLFPRTTKLPSFSGIQSKLGSDYVDVRDAKNQNISISAWRDSKNELVLTGAMPIMSAGKINGVLMLVSKDQNIKEALGETWFNILKIFSLTLIVTILLSIYLSGVIARPLRKLAWAAENVRKGKLKHTDIPDMSDRHDEIGELSLVLKDMTYALWDRMDSIESFAADVSHEIKNPLTSLKSAVETAKIVTKKEDLDKLLDVIKHDIERLDRLITDISSVSKLDAELSRESFQVVDLKNVFMHLIDAYKSPLEREASFSGHSDEALKDGVMITLDLPDYADLRVRGSEGRLIQVFQNIIANALSFASIKSQIKIAIEAKEGRVTILIEDEGPGIPEGKLKDIFERFYSERPNHEEYGRHSGLGLSICKQIITAHNGIIYAENKTERSGEITGARFVVILNAI